MLLCLLNRIRIFRVGDVKGGFMTISFLAGVGFFDILLGLSATVFASELAVSFILPHNENVVFYRALWHQTFGVYCLKAR